MSKVKKQYIAAPIFFLVMLLDSHLTRTFSAWSDGANVWKTHFLLLILMFCVPRFSKRYMITTTIVLGSIFDLYYMGVLGVYAVSLPLAVWGMYLLYDLLYQNIFTMFFGWIILITGYELAASGIQVIFKLSVINPIYFATNFLGPTLLVNILFFFIIYYIVRVLFRWE
ncbi:rod shape-determining protein MreD [Tetragenococcus osmophilus]|uniref:Rod shape-determining protein MreD n=1 Tax=Tetragenococcus osmophilus TaxID=526944 RepID=A0AA37XLG4_9ENTE|nr:rod shape-determining protein MreD [Tetragenococcus osmophilus]AYW47725.1 rod shape-determining protein MreD [Tetragenococcus osmophilus]GMA53383.1 rod shape-determining protein MreD [Alicyclobacillus contaminans]GMA72663.1 rod shape-determining protein MreD [Tetragenococcus osmophilus]